MKNLAPKLQALLKQIESGNLKTTNAKLLAHIHATNGSHIEKMRRNLDIPHQTLTSSISHLEDMGLIYAAGTVQGENRPYTLYKFEPLPMLQEINRNQIRIKKFEGIKKRLLNDFSDLMSDELKNLLK